MYEFKNDMKRESSLVFVLTLVTSAELIYLLVNLLVNNKPAEGITGILFPLILFIILFCVFGFWFLYAVVYKVEVDSETIKLRTLFKKRTVSISDIESYEIGKYRRSNYHQFKINTKAETFFINIKDRDKLIKNFYKHNINKIKQKIYKDNDIYIRYKI